MTENDLIDFTPELKAEAKKIVSEYKYGPLYTPPVLLGSADGPKGTLLVPGTNGGADWGGAAFDPETGILYVPSAHMPTVIALGKSQHPESTLPYVKQQVPWPFGPQGLPDPFKPPYSRLVAIDLNKGDILLVGRQRRRPPQSPGVQGTQPSTDRHARPQRGARHQDRSCSWVKAATAGVGLPPGGTWGGKMFRAFDKKTGAIVVGDGTARRRQQRADDLHGRRQAVHRRRGFGPAVPGRDSSPSRYP